MWASEYGRNKPVRAHRVAWEMTVGPLEAGQHILHSCDNGLCVNPKHLSVGTHTDNMRDASAKGRLHQVPRPSRQKITDAQAIELMVRYRDGESSTALALEYGVTKTLVSNLVNGKQRSRLHGEQFNRLGRPSMRKPA
jgi:hypothetical protein